MNTFSGYVKDNIAEEELQSATIKTIKTANFISYLNKRDFKGRSSREKT
ncbi:hypothetical protein [Polaribacter sp. HL-MS24]|nr:hypothetical protein [Polaribacter sp. HL-MS24]WOC41207.1 hypothetical protein RRF69_05515 [Polaribacter sp. HL-MS24]